MMMKRFAALALSAMIALNPLAAFAQDAHEHEHEHEHEAAYVALPAVHAASITLSDGQALPAALIVGDALTLSYTGEGEVASWRYEIETVNYSETFAVGKDYAGAQAEDAGAHIARAVKGWNLRSGVKADVHIAALDAKKQVLAEAELALDATQARIVTEYGLPLPESIAQGESYTLHAANGAKVTRWQVDLVGADGETIVSTTSAGADVAKALDGCIRSASAWGEVDLSAGLSLRITGLDADGAKLTDSVLIGVTEAPETEAVSGTHCPACGEKTKSATSHYVKNCGHYRCDGQDHRQADCKTPGHCNAYYTKHKRMCNACRGRLCDEGGYNPENCYECDNCGESMCVSGHLDHTVCEGCGKCKWDTKRGEHEACEACGLYHCTNAGRLADHSLLKCGVHTDCNKGNVYHKRGECGVAGHYTCDGVSHEACPSCDLYACSAEYAYLDHDRCEECGMRKCDKRYVASEHVICAHCGGMTCEKDTNHELYSCGVEGHYRCTMHSHKNITISKYCNQTPQHKACEEDNTHYCDPDAGGCGQFYPCKFSNVHTTCRMCGKLWCDRSDGGHQTPCGNPEHRPCQLSGFRYSDHAICEHCGNPVCKGTHAHCGTPYPCKLCGEIFTNVRLQHTMPCGHLDCQKDNGQDHGYCDVCTSYFCDGNTHQEDCPKCNGAHCVSADGYVFAHTAIGCGTK